VKKAQPQARAVKGIRHQRERHLRHRRRDRGADDGRIKAEDDGMSAAEIIEGKRHVNYDLIPAGSTRSRRCFGGKPSRSSKEKGRRLQHAEVTLRRTAAQANQQTDGFGRSWRRQDRSRAGVICGPDAATGSPRTRLRWSYGASSERYRAHLPRPSDFARGRERKPRWRWRSGRFISDGFGAAVAVDAENTRCRRRGRFSHLS